MMPPTLLLILNLAFLAAIVWKLFLRREDGDPYLQSELDRRLEEIGEMKNKVKTLESDNDKMKEKGKLITAEHMKLQASYDVLSRETAEYRANEKRREQENRTATEKLEAAREGFENERKRVVHEDEERMQMETQERDRLWAEHENAVKALLTELCKKPQYAFTAYSNDALPEGFHGNFKPDFMIEFLNQYVIFDPKKSEAKNLQNYIAENVKKTAAKAKKKGDIYPTIFFVIPTEVIGELKQKTYYEEGFTFYVLPPEALEAILAVFKRLETYEFAQEMDPQERENVIDLLANLDFHISTRNAVDFHLLQHGIATLAKAKNMDPALATEIAMKKAKIRHLNMNTAEQKQLIADPESVQKRLLELTEPLPQITKKELENVRGS